MARKALVVDAHAMTLDILKYVLEQNGYDITRATDGDQAVQALDAEDYLLKPFSQSDSLVPIPFQNLKQFFRLHQPCRENNALEMCQDNLQSVK